MKRIAYSVAVRKMLRRSFVRDSASAPSRSSMRLGSGGEEGWLARTGEERVNCRELLTSGQWESEVPLQIAFLLAFAGQLQQGFGQRRQLGRQGRAGAEAGQQLAVALVEGAASRQAEELGGPHPPGLPG